MGYKSKKKAKTRLDAYYRLAKDQGYRARSAFKLIQLNRKYDFLGKSRVVVDLCAAPGGWCQVAAQFMPVGSKIVGVDLVPIAPIRGVKTFVGDITEDKTRKTIKTWLKKEPVDCVIHDGAPNVGGVWAKDMFAQNALVLSAAKMACDLLRPGGWFVTKVFRSPDYQKLMWVLKQLFEKVEATKPLASRMESAEIFVTCHGYKAPRQLDPKLFQAQHAFSDVGEEKIMSASGVMIQPKSNVPQGYEEFATLPNKVVSLTEYLECGDPRTLLQTQHEIRFVSEEEKALMKTRYCKPELIHNCFDLQQVGEGDRRRLLRMRDQLLRERAARRAKNEGYNITSASAAAAASSSTQPRSKAALVAAGMTDDELLGYNVSDEDEDDQDEDAEENQLEIDGEEELDDLARQLLAQKRAEEKERKRKSKKLIDQKLKKVRGLINFDPNEANANAVLGNEDEEEGGDNDEDYDDEHALTAEGGRAGAILRLGKYDAKHTAAALDEYAINLVDNDTGRGLPNIPLNAITDVHLDPDDDMNNAGALDEGADVAEFNPEQVLLDEDEQEVDVDDTGNYIRATHTSAVSEKFRVGRSYAEEMDAMKKKQENKKPLTAEDIALRDQEKKDKREEALEEAGKKSKWERRHLNVEQVLRDTFAKPKQSNKKRKSRTEEELIEMGGADNDNKTDVAAAATASRLSAAAVSKAERQAVLAHRLHDESGTDSDYDVDEDDDDINSLQAAFSDSDRDDEEEDRHNATDAAASRTALRMSRPDAAKRGTSKFVPDMGKLTAQEQVKALRREVEQRNKKLTKQQQQQQSKKNKKGGADTTFEEIPIAMTDPTIRARTLAIATKMLDKKSRHEILENGVHRYMNNDDDDLPDWFVDDEQKHYQLNIPVTNHDVEQERARFIEMNSRPSKRIMEAVGRKRRKAQRMLRGMLEKGKSDPMMRNKTSNLSVRKLMRSTAVKGEAGKKKKKGPLDNKKKGEMKRDRQRLKKAKKGGGRR